MLTIAPITTDIVLLGGGHAHVDVIKRFGMRPEPGVRLTLVTRDVMTPYSGMIPGLLRGVYEADVCHIDLGRLCRWAGVRLIRAAATGLSVGAQAIQFAGRPPLGYDLLSIDVGSTPPASEIDGAETFALPIKPLDRFLEALAAMDANLKDRAHLAVIGAGAGGVETALGLKRRFERQGKRVDVTLVSSSARILPGHAGRVAARMSRALSDAGVSVRLGVSAARIAETAVHLSDGAVLENARAILTTGAAAPTWLADSGLDLDSDGFIAVNERLQSTNCTEVFAAGDCAAFLPRPLPKAGVYAVRQGPPLARNLRRAALGEPLEPWRPQSVTLSLMATGDGGAIVSYGPLAASGKWAWRWKDWIDQRWMEKYRDLPPMRSEASRPTAEGEPPPPMRCGGCGAKVASGPLRRVLERLGMSDAGGDDAAIVEPPAGKSLVQTVDHFKAFIDDPYTFGEIAAVHALGDLYAMGAEPIHALVTAILPHAAEPVVERDLLQLLAGVKQALDAAGASLIGGHTGEGAELAVGLALSGTVDPGDAIPKGGALPGDRLILTKPLGVGAILAADMQGKADADDVAAALDLMRRSNAEAAAILRTHGARALTDVTGFGLAGHLIEVADASGLTAEINLAAVPALPPALDIIAGGVESTMAEANAAFGERIAGHAPDAPRQRLLFDPQTAGGLLAALPPENAQAALDALGDGAAEFGELIEPAEKGAAIKIL